MAVRINPCFGCPLRHGCERRAEFASRVRGLGLRSATFDCDRLAEALQPGTRIEIAAPIRSYAKFGDDYTITRAHVPATITTNRRTEFACVVDREPLKAAMHTCGDEETDVDRVRFRRTMRHSRIVRFLDEPKRTLCEFGNPCAPDGKCDSRGDECNCGQREAM